MKTRPLLWFTIAVAGLCGMRPAQADTPLSAGIEIRSVSDFYEPLSRDGYWVETSQYGRCWQPAYVERNWRPYSSGHWVWCDQGWYWESDEPWAWATYHYGRWVWDSFYGWVWMPDVEWAPAWVCWREGGGYVGWAPLPPNYEYEPVRQVVVVAPQYFVFVECRHFCQPIQPSILVVNQTVINQTVNTTKFGKGSRVFINQGPSLNVIERSNPGKVVKVNAERRMPAEVLQARQGRRDLTPPQPAVIRGSRQYVDASVVANPLPVTEAQPNAKAERPKEKRVPPPAAVVVQPKSQPATEQMDSGKGRKLGYRKHEDETGTIGMQDR